MKIYEISRRSVLKGAGSTVILTKPILTNIAKNFVDSLGKKTVLLLEELLKITNCKNLYRIYKDTYDQDCGMWHPDLLTNDEFNIYENFLLKWAKTKEG